MRILIVCESIDGGNGWARYAQLLIGELRDLGHEVNVLMQADGLPSATQIVAQPGRAWAVARAIRRYVHHHNPDIIHCTVEPYALALAFIPRLGCRSVFTLHGSYSIRLLDRWFARILFSRALKYVARCIAVSEYTRSRIVTECQERTPKIVRSLETKTTVITNGVRLVPYVTPTHHGNRRSILLVGPVKPRKGILEAMEACARYRALSTAPFILSIIGTVGDDAYVRQVHRDIDRLRLKDCVRLLGRVSQSELEEAYRTADLLLLPANTTRDTFEGFGLVYIEANMYGVPVIGPDNSGAQEAISDGMSGYKCAPSDADAIAKRMYDVLDTHRISPDACRAWAEQHNIRGKCLKVEQVYTALTSA